MFTLVKLPYEQFMEILVWPFTINAEPQKGGHASVDRPEEKIVRTNFPAYLKQPHRRLAHHLKTNGRQSPCEKGASLHSDCGIWRICDEKECK